MNYDTIERIKKLTGVKDTCELEMFYRMANSVLCSEYAGDQREDIITLLASHFIASSRNLSSAETSRSLGDASKSWAKAQLGDGLKGTLYGQQALLLDVNGCLQKLGKRKATMEAF